VVDEWIDDVVEGHELRRIPSLEQKRPDNLRADTFEVEQSRSG
jgi:hypothetical protein